MDLTDDKLKNLSQFDLLRLCIDESVESHKKHLHKPFWKGSHDALVNVLDTMRQLEQLKYKI